MRALNESIHLMIILSGLYSRLFLCAFTEISKKHQNLPPKKKVQAEGKSSKERHPITGATFSLEMEKTPSAATIVPIVVLVLWLMMSPALACPYDGSKCKDCIVKQLKCGCPSCAPVLRCMARCLWGGGSTSECIQSCDCGNNGNPKLSDCKKCMSQCKCSCTVY